MNYIGEHPLNLISKVAIVTSCSSTQGAAVCRALLNSNAFVLGIDTETPHDSTRSSKASHFQFLKAELDDQATTTRIVEAVKHHYQKENLDFLVNISVEENEMVNMKWMTGVLDVMTKRKSGLVLNILGEKASGEESMISIARSSSHHTKENGIRWNVLVSHEIISNSEQRFILDSDTKTALEKHVEEYHSQRTKAGYAVEKEKDLANLALFFCTKLGVAINGALVGIDGVCVSL